MARLTCFLAICMLCLGFGAQQAQAIPVLQLYIEGATYDSETESWVAAPGGSSGGVPFRLWAIGNIDGPGSAGAIHDVRLSVAYSADYYHPGNPSENLNITLKPSRAGGIDVGEYGGFTDPSKPIEVTPNVLVQTTLGAVDTSLTDGVVINGGAPMYGPLSAPDDLKALPTHGEYGAETVWREYSLGDFQLPADSPIADFIDAFPTELHAGGRINVYDVSVINGGGVIHFDLYDTVYSGTKAKAQFAPFSHDAHIIPEPASLLIWSLLGLIGMGVTWWRLR